MDELETQEGVISLANAREIKAQEPETQGCEGRTCAVLAPPHLRHWPRPSVLGAGSLPEVTVAPGVWRGSRAHALTDCACESLSRPAAGFPGLTPGG